MEAEERFIVRYLRLVEITHQVRAYDGYDTDGPQQLDLGTHARMPQKGALATKRQKSCVCGLWLYCVCGGYGSGPSGSECDSDDGSGDDDSDSDLDPRSSDGDPAASHSFQGQHPTVPAAAGMDGSFPKQPYSHLQAARVAEKRDRDDDCDFDLDCSDGDSSPAGSSEDDSGSAAVQCLGQPQEHEACSEQAMTADTSERLKPTHPQPTEVSECLCPASHRREYYSDDFAGGGGYCSEGTVGQAVRRA